MWLENECKLCLIQSRTSDLIKLGGVHNLPKLLSYLSEAIQKGSRSEAFAESFREVARLLSSQDPYAEYKKRLVEIGREVASIVERKLEASGWDLKMALRIAAAANIIDSNVLGYKPKKLELAIWDEPAIEEIPERIPERVLYVLDNEGEAQIDYVVIQALERNGISVTSVVRSEPYEIDTMGDSLPLGSQLRTPGNISPIRWLEGGFLIAKGIANAEAYLEWGLGKPALLLFRAKCDVLARRLGVEKNAPIIVGGVTFRRLILTE
ncbi:ARMT1-like domain-containing protein [Thermoproteus tenax]|uniref:ATP-grasp domain with redox center n=1 Tax=Thermoproteus tenax (strain ATCC 35583 / DSM 2078 / JCM 9277 / NBRC 100435 / Kra 1) TaxID=768679 RepID=G4RMM7_THETK|nr:ARMT1-like domain-containing protein [Thermoproteus tenax]CCC82703.1 ATP-grasp domain with redox center [Thermoproteus tenax Kra 1]